MAASFLFFLIAFLFLSGTFFAAITYLLFWYEHQSRINTLFPDKKEARSAAYKGFFSAIKSQFLTFVLFPAGEIAQVKQKRTPPCPLETKHPIIMIHGLFHNSSAWIFYRHWLKQAGFPHCASFYYSSRKEFETIAEEFDAYLNNLFINHPDASPILLGHSLGGLFIRNWAGHSEHREKVAGIITLGAPMLGSKLATFSIVELGQQLEFNGPLIQQITATESAPPVPCYALYSPVDNMVLPRDSASTVPARWQAVQTAPISHLAMLSHKPTAELAINYIRSFHTQR